MGRGERGKECRCKEYHLSKWILKFYMKKMKFLFVHVDFYKNPFWWECVKIQCYSISGGFKNDYVIYGRTLLVYFPGEDIVFSCLVITIVLWWIWRKTNGWKIFHCLCWNFILTWLRLNFNWIPGSVRLTLWSVRNTDVLPAQNQLILQGDENDDDDDDDDDFDGNSDLLPAGNQLILEDDLINIMLIGL